ncbi:asparaginase domain-containing protein [Patescibacteria group bacterium]
MKNAVHLKQGAHVINYKDLMGVPSIVKDQLSHKKASVPTVAVLYCGGTVGMVKNDDGYLVPTNNSNYLLDPLALKGLNDRFNVIWFQVYPQVIDSTNSRWWHWVSIANAIRILYSEMDGFIVLGGTDTMSYLTAALNFIFPNIGKPIVCTGSQIPMGQLGDDATRNLYFAIEAAALGDLSGCHLAFADVLLHGLHIFKVRDRGFRAFESPTRHKIGEFNGEVVLYGNAPRRNPIVNADRLEFFPGFREGLKVVQISPATSSESLLYDANDPSCDALLLITFGAGNIRDESVFDGELTHIDIVKSLYDDGYPVVLGSPMMDGKIDSPYASGARAVSKEIGGISAQDTCGPALEVKIMRCIHLAWRHDQDSLDIDIFRKEMFRNHIGEINH